MATKKPAAKKARTVGRAVVGARRNARATPMASAAKVVDAGGATANQGQSHLPHVDRAARDALKKIGHALRNLQGLDSGELEHVKAAVASTEAL